MSVTRLLLFVRRAIAAVTVAVTAGRVAVGQTYVYTVNAAGNLSTASNYLGGTAPPVSGGAGVNLVFNTFANTGGYAVTNDRGNPFVLNSATFAGSSAGAVVLSNATGNLLQFDGAGAQIVANAVSSATFGTATATAPVVMLNAPTTVGGTGTGGVAFTASGASASLQGPGQLIINRPAATQFTSAVTVSGLNLNFAGGVRLDAGNLVVGANGALSQLGTGPISYNGGTLGVASGLTIPNAIAITSAGAPLAVVGQATTLTGVISDPNYVAGSPSTARGVTVYSSASGSNTVL